MIKFFYRYWVANKWLLNQIGLKNFKLAYPIQNEDIFILVEKEIKRIENEKINIAKYKSLLKLYDQADIINDIV